MKIGVVGAGSWGTTLANLLAGKGYEVSIWALENEVVDDINQNHRNSIFLPDAELEENLRAQSDIEAVVADKALVVSAAPSHAVRNLIQRYADHISPETILASVSKGLDPGTHETMEELFTEMLPATPLAILSGPSFAREVFQRRPTAVVAASRSSDVARKAQEWFATDYFRVYTSSDTVGVELGGALKNVVAIAAGIVDGLQLGFNPRAALITRGLAECTRLGVAMGADPHTFSGLAGMGDMLLTCTGPLSRNRSLGEEIARGRTLEEITSERRTVAEGVNTTREVRELASRHDVEMPVAKQVHEILFDGKKPQQAIRDLMARELKPERWS